MTPEEYGRLTGRSEKDIRRCYLPTEKQNDPNARLRIRIDTMNMIDGITDIRDSEKEMTKPNENLKESFNGCAWMTEMHREQKRNAVIKDRKKTEWDDMLYPDDSEIKRVMAHEKRRTKQHTKNRWIELAARYSKEIAFSGDAEKNEIRRYLQEVRDRIEDFDRKSGTKSWARTEKTVFT